MVALTALTIVEFSVDKIYQRVGSTKDIPFSFTYTPSNADCSALEALISIVAGGTALNYTQCTNIVASSGSGTAVIPSVPQGAWYKHTLRDGNNHSIVSSQSSRQWGVGIGILIGGHSQMARMGAGNTSSGLTPDTYTRYWINDPIGLGVVSTALWATNVGANGSGDGPAGCNQLGLSLRTAMVGFSSTLATVPILLFDCGVAGSDMASWITGQSSWSNAIGANGTANASIGTDFELVLFDQGTNDCETGDNPVNFATDLTTVCAQFLTLTGRNTSTLKIGIIIEGSVGAAGYTSSKFTTIRNAQLAQATQSGCFYAGSAEDLLPDNALIHWITAQYGRLGRRLSQGCIKILGFSPIGSDGPKILQAYCSAGSTTLTIEVLHSGGFTLLDGAGSASGTGLTGFSFTSSVGGQTFTAPRLSSGKILSTLGTARASNETISFTYANGGNPYGFTGSGDTDNDVIYDNQSTLIGDSTGFPLQTTSGSISVTLTAIVNSQKGGMVMNVGKLLNK